MKNLIFRAIFIYFFTVFSMRVLGKRQVGQMQMSELVTAFFLSELATYAVTEKSISVFLGLVPIVAIVFAEFLVSYLTLKSGFFKKIFDFSPTVIIKDGKVLRDSLKKSRMTLDELLSFLRLEGYFDLREVRFAFLEPNGSVSVVPYDKCLYPKKTELNLSPEENGYTVFVIQDGLINKKALETIGKDGRWLEKEIKKHKGKNPSDFFLIGSDWNGNTFSQKKTQSK